MMLYLKLAALIIGGGFVIALSGFMTFLTVKYFYLNFIKVKHTLHISKVKHYDRLTQIEKPVQVTGKYEIFGREELEDKYEK